MRPQAIRENADVDAELSFSLCEAKAKPVNPLELRQVRVIVL